MPTADRGLYREAIRATLANRAGNAPTAGEIAETMINTWLQVAARLSPVIGVRGTDVLFGRSLHLTSIAYPWLAMAGNQGDRASLLSIIKTRIEGCEADAAADAGYALLTTFVELLTTLIGESLTERLLDPVWAPPPPTSE
jgi:hypothetical protein